MTAALDARIIDLTHDGLGVADLDGRRLFVAGALPGEQVRLAPRRRRRGFQEADLIEIVEPVTGRVTPPCEYFGRCGGCAVQHLSQEGQLAFKGATLKEALARIGGVEPEQWLAPIQGPQWRYRRKARLGARLVEGKGRVLVGFRERSTRFLTDMAHCRILAAPFDGLLGELAELIGGTTLCRRLPQVEAAVGDHAAAMVLRALDDPTDADLDAFAQFGRRHGIDVYLQRGGPGTVRALDPSNVRTLSYSLPAVGVTLEFAPTDFIQVNAQVNAAMVRLALDLLEPDTADRVLDLYCGIGNFGLPLASSAGEVLGVEGDAGLVARAVHNAKRNGLSNTRFLSGDLAQPEWSFMREQWDLVVLDPPRSGAPAVVSQMARMGPRKVVYVSCHPATLARDAKELVNGQGYRLAAACVADMFPHTHHVEAMALFER